MKTFLDVLQDPPEPVDCGTCPVSMACAVGDGGTGWCYACCEATAVHVRMGSEDVLLVVDCARHGFVRQTPPPNAKLCVLCAGDVMLDALRDDTALMKSRYVPTRWAKVPLDARLRRWREVLPHYQQVKNDTW